MKLFVKIFSYSTIASIALLVVLAYLNMVIILEFPNQLKLYILPIIAGLLISSITSVISYSLISKARRLQANTPENTSHREKLNLAAARGSI